MLIVILVLFLLATAIWAGVNFFYGMIETYLISQGEGGGVVLEYMPILKLVMFAVIIAMLLGQTYVMKKRIDNKKPSTM